MDVFDNLTPQDKEALAERVLAAYSYAPDRVKMALPEVAYLLENLASPSPDLRDDARPFGLTQRERDFHKEALEDILRRFRSLTAEEVVKGLEHGAILLHDNRDRFEPMPRVREELRRLVKKATGIRPRKTGQPAKKVIREGEASRTVPVVRGLEMHLTSDFKLLKVTMDPEQWAFYCRAMSIVGIGTDKDGATDVAENHDAYLEEIYYDWHR